MFEILPNYSAPHNKVADATPCAERARQYPLNIYKGVQSRKPVKSGCMPLSRLLHTLSSPARCDRKEDAPLFSLVEFYDPAHDSRSLAGIKACHAIVGDIDHGFSRASFDAGMDALRDAGAAVVAYETFNSTAEAPRWRVVVLLDAPIAPSDYPACWVGLNALFGRMLDPGAKDAARLSYMYGFPQGQERRCIVLEGKGQGIAAVLSAQAASLRAVGPTTSSRDGQSPLASGLETTFPPASFNRLLPGCAAMRAAATVGGGSEPMWRAMLGLIKHCTEGEALAHAISARDPRYAPAETQSKLDGWTSGPPTCEHIAQLAPECAACPSWEAKQ